MTDILIRGKDLLLPERLGEILEVFVFSDGTIQYGKHYGYAIELPEHGDLIDRDAFRAENEYYLNREFINPKYEDTLDDLLKDAPAIVPSNKEETE